jgi:eukaryotic-like serine/threonine-protein kinase
VSDVYSLGVVLYRLLTGQSPYGARTNNAQRVAEILSDTAPTRPSLVRTDDRQRQRGIDADLDNILLMALRKEPQERYPSVEQFSSDLRNYLAGMPVKARGNSLRYRASKFVRRRKVEIAAGVVMVCALLGALAFSIREARVAERERQVAQRHFDSVRKLANTMLLQLHDELERDSGSLKAREMMVKTSLEYLDSLYQQSGSDRRLQEELATAYIKVAAILGRDATGANRGDYPGSLRSYERAIALLTPLLLAEPANHRVGWALGTAYVEQAALLMVVHGPKYAREAADRGVALTEFFAPAMADEEQRMRQLSSGYGTQGQILGFMGLTPEAMDAFDRLIAVAEAYWHSHPEDERALIALSRAYNLAALTDDTRLSTSESYERNVALLKKSLWADEELMKLKPNEPDNLIRLSTSRFNLGNYEYARGRYVEALELYELAVPVARDDARNAEDANAQYRLALYETKLAQTLLKLRKIEEARVLLLRCAKILQTLLERDGSLRTEYAVGLNAVRLGELYAHLAGNPRLSREKQLDLWHQARDSLQRGVTSLQKVTANAKLQEIDMEVVNDGVASLARAEGALARASGE